MFKLQALVLFSFPPSLPRPVLPRTGRSGADCAATARAGKKPFPRAGTGRNGKISPGKSDPRPRACLADRLRRSLFLVSCREDRRADPAVPGSPERPPAVGKGGGSESLGTKTRVEQSCFEHARHGWPIGLRRLRGDRSPRSAGRSSYTNEKESPPGDPCDMVVAAYDFQGRRQWLVRPGKFASKHGFCTSPVLFENLLILNGDHDGDAYLVALDRRPAGRSGRRPARTRPAAIACPSSGRSRAATS